MLQCHSVRIQEKKIRETVGSNQSEAMDVQSITSKNFGPATTLTNLRLSLKASFHRLMWNVVPHKSVE